MMVIGVEVVGSRKGKKGELAVKLWPGAGRDAGCSVIRFLRHMATILFESASQ